MNKTVTANSISEVAATMIVPPTQAQPDGEQEREAVAPTGEEVPVEQQAAEDYGPADEDIGTLEEGGEPEQEAADDATDHEDGTTGQEHFDPIELADDALLSVMVDGEAVEVTLADLKRAYSGEGAISKRLQEATEAKKAVEAERQVVKQELEAGREKLVQAFRAFDAMMFQPRVKKPDAALQQRDPTAYLMQMEAYREDQNSIQARRSQVQQAMQQYEAKQAEDLQKLRTYHAEKLVEALPDLRDPQKGPELSKAIIETAQHYGFQQSEIAAAFDHRIFQMAADAAAYRKLISAQKIAPKQAQAKTRVLAPGTARAQQQTATARQAAASFNRARKTGKVEDVAKTLILNPKR